MVSHGNILASFTQAVIQAQILLSVHNPPPHPTPEGKSSFANFILSVILLSPYPTLLATVFAHTHRLPLSGVPVTLAYLPMHHAYGLHAYIFRMTLAPATLVILRKWDVVKALECIPKYVLFTYFLLSLFCCLYFLLSLAVISLWYAY
jgi:acyl-CoA synthetase (AMP-forming)/AMP-acid ligase II